MSPIEERVLSEVVGLFNSRTAAARAVDELFSRGYDATNVGYIDRHRDQSSQVVTEVGDEGTSEYTESVGEAAAKGAAGGAMGGAAVGAGAGLLASAGMLVVPGIGPFLAAGTLAATLGGAAAGVAGGAVLGGAAGAILGAATSDPANAEDDTSSYYREGVERGGSLVTVEVMDGQENEPAGIMRTAGAEKVDVYGGAGWM